MTSISALENIFKKGLFGDYEDKNENQLIKIQERKNLLIVQIVQYKNSSALIKEIDIDGLNLTNEVLKVSSNSETRILWCGPKNWLLVSTKKNLLIYFFFIQLQIWKSETDISISVVRIQSYLAFLTPNFNADPLPKFFFDLIT